MSRIRWRRGARNRPKASAAALSVELPLGRCYVGIGGYGTVEILLRHDRAPAGPAVVIGLPVHTGTGLAECVVQTGDHMVIRNADGLIAELPVQRIVEQGSYAGFRLLDAPPPPGDGEAASDPLQAFEQYMAGVSARAIRQRERAERQFTPAGEADDPDHWDG